jgi:hypothetical protein
MIDLKCFHDFRINTYKNIVYSGGYELVAKMISGHKTRSVLDRYNIYNIVNDTDFRLATERKEIYLK